MSPLLYSSIRRPRTRILGGTVICMRLMYMYHEKYIVYLVFTPKIKEGCPLSGSGNPFGYLPYILGRPPAYTVTIFIDLHYQTAYIEVLDIGVHVHLLYYCTHSYNTA